MNTRPVSKVSGQVNKANSKVASRMNINGIVGRVQTPRKRPRYQKGFTIIELMVVVAIVSILAMISIPAYLDYSVRAQVSEGLEIFGAVKKGVTESYFTNGSQWPASNQAAGLVSAVSHQTKYVDSVSVITGGNVVVTFGIPDLGASNTIIYQPTDSDGAIDWRCTAGSVAPKYRPPVCRP